MIGDAMYMFGGLTKGQDAKVWEYDFASNLWQSHNVTGGPGPLTSFAMAPVNLANGVQVRQDINRLVVVAF